MNPPTQADALAAWFATAPGQYVLDWERAQLDRALADVFGFHALQLGLPQIDGLNGNRMPHRWLALDRVRPQPEPVANAPAVDTDDNHGAEADAGLWRAVDGDAGLTAPPRAAALFCHFDALPFPNNSLDLVLLPHTLELARDPHLTLREVERVLVPEGRVAIVGFNPASLWGLRQHLGRLRRGVGGKAPLFMPREGDFIGYRRLRDWLRLLSFEVEGGRFGCYRAPLHSATWLQRSAWMDATGERWWPVFGALYFVLAVKRVRGMRLVGLARRLPAKPQAAPAVVANQQGLRKEKQ